MTDELLATGCVYGQYSSLDGFSYESIRYVGMTATTKQSVSAEKIAAERLKAHLREVSGTSTNQFKTAWYQDVWRAGGEILYYVLAEVHDTTRQHLGDLECEWIHRLGGPILPSGSVIQLLNLTHGRDGGWGIIRDNAWREEASRRGKQRYATVESRKDQSDRMRKVYALSPELRETLSQLQKKIQNRPEILAKNRQRGVDLWECPEYREKQVIEKPCEFCGRLCTSYRGYGVHILHCSENPDRVRPVACPMQCGRFVRPSSMSHHLNWCPNNPDAMGQPYGSRAREECPICGKECGAGAGLKAHMKWNHDQPIVRDPKDDLSTAHKKTWAAYTREERMARVAKSRAGLQRQRRWTCNDCDVTSTGAGIHNHQVISGHHGRHQVQLDPAS